MIEGDNSDALYQAATMLMPGGVSSPVRALTAVGGGPMSIVDGRGALVTDADGRKFIDLQMAFGPLPLGHAHPTVVQAVQEAAARGLHFGALHPDEVRLASQIRDKHPAIERLRFVNSGTEAVMSAARLARAATGRDLIIKFAGGYHGHCDHFLTRAGSGLATFGLSSSAGVPPGTAKDAVTLPFDDESLLESFFAKHGDRVAAAIVEGVPANNGLLLQRPEWHVALRRLTRDHGALLIVDEVITGFRLAWGGATELLGLDPDLVTLGKIIGGGMPVGAYGGRRDLMGHVSPEGSMYQAGTLSGSPVAMAAGIATLEAMAQVHDVHADLATRTKMLAKRLHNAAVDADYAVSTPHVGSLLWLVPEGAKDRRTATALSAKTIKRYSALHQAMRKHGVYLPPSAYEVAFISTAHTDAVIDGVVEAFSRSIQEVN